MKRMLLRSGAFVRTGRRMVKRNLRIAEDIEACLELLSEDAFDSRLKTHKLKGALEGSWACTVGYDLRIVFSFVKHQQSEAILLEAVGTHEEVY